MHHHNPFILSAIVRFLKPKIEGDILLKCFSNSLDEMVLEFENYTIRSLFFEGEVLFSFNAEKVNENRLYKPQFQYLIGKKLLALVEHPFERSFHFEFEDNLSLFFKCYGRKSNIILLDNNEAITAFRKNIEKDLETNFLKEVKSVQAIFKPEFFENEKHFLKHYPFLPSSFYAEIKDNLNDNNFNELILKYQNIKAIEWQPNTFEIEMIANVASDFLTQISTFTNQYLKQNVLLTSKNKLLEKLNKAIAEKENYFKTNTVALQTLKQKRSDEELGNIILSNIHWIKNGEKMANVIDIYTNEPIDIKLNDKLNAVENAAQYFKKAKAKPMAEKLLLEKIVKAESELSVLKQELQNTILTQSVKELKKVTANSVVQKLNEKEQHTPYKLFEIDGYQLLVGKNADSNDKILSKYSDKNDVWLHAKDVGGSHVIVKVKRNIPLPNTVLEKAASLAAYYSKSRNQSLVTVTHTLRKFVRKIKGADKGLVTVSNEKTILVKPDKGGN